MRLDTVRNDSTITKEALKKKIDGRLGRKNPASVVMMQVPSIEMNEPNYNLTSTAIR